MISIKTTLLGLFLLLSLSAHSDAPQVNHAQTKWLATEFFHAYLDTYNRRLGHPERQETFLNELSALIHTPFIMAPPSANPPFYPQSDEAFARVFGGFVKQLEQKGAVRMEWQEIRLKVLTDNKILANNVGRALNAKNETVYETTSVYLLHRSDEQWKIVMFSPYDMANKLDIERL